MKELYLVGFIMTYIAFFLKQDKSIDNLNVDTLKVSNHVLYVVLLLPLLSITGKGVEHLLKIISITFGIISISNIVKAEKSQIKEYIHPLTLGGLLVSIYNQNILKNNIIGVYVYYIFSVIIATTNETSNLSKIVYECALIHLIFFFTK